MYYMKRPVRGGILLLPDRALCGTAVAEEHEDRFSQALHKPVPHTILVYFFI